ncbi:hypothetical protein CLV30_101419 [Haloactinopolyspora alba]|uniref:Uncharacterized protein n=1 Tax=Haloactinopolyspora alba TaxID=648780 RepID=A0A2P8EG49_9ACTN|nr:hypothetical protein [Haloactinopolyspora alba]PSL08447.1 hypothetical protein CLV30_101419 [Haloactinopolyspora alba]
MSGEENSVILRRAFIAATAGDADTFKAHIDTLQHRGWDNFEYSITEALFIAVETIPAATPDSAALISQNVADRFEGSLAIARPMMEAVIRGAAGDGEIAQGVPRNVALIYSLLVVGQLAHDGHVSIDDALGIEA